MYQCIVQVYRVSQVNEMYQCIVQVHRVSQVNEMYQCIVQVYRVSQSGQETEETYLSDTLVNYSNDARVNFYKFGLHGSSTRCCESVCLSVCL